MRAYLTRQQGAKVVAAEKIAIDKDRARFLGRRCRYQARSIDQSRLITAHRLIFLSSQHSSAGTITRAAINSGETDTICSMALISLARCCRRLAITSRSRARSFL